MAEESHKACDGSRIVEDQPGLDSVCGVGGSTSAVKKRAQYQSESQSRETSRSRAQYSRTARCQPSLAYALLKGCT
eukprot:7649950-Prorocentrum_lima.AAC.1